MRMEGGVEVWGGGGGGWGGRVRIAISTSRGENEVSVQQTLPSSRAALASGEEASHGVAKGVAPSSCSRSSRSPALDGAPFAAGPLKRAADGAAAAVAGPSTGSSWLSPQPISSTVSSAQSAMSCSE